MIAGPALNAALIAAKAARAVGKDEVSHRRSSPHIAIGEHRYVWQRPPSWLSTSMCAGVGRRGRHREIAPVRS